MKKIISILSVILVSCAVCSALMIGSSVRASALTSGDYTYEVNDGKATITDYSGTADSIVIPSTLDGYPVVKLGDHSFYQGTFSKATIPDSVTEIATYAFAANMNLKSIVIPDSVLAVGEDAFGSCRALESVVIGKGVETIEVRAFSDTGLKSITIPDNVKTIGNSAFTGCPKLENVIIGDGVTVVGEYAFNFCSRLESVTVGKNVKKFEQRAFNNCDQISKVYISDLVKWNEIEYGYDTSSPLSYGADLYVNGTLLTDLVIPQEITDIGKKFLRGCSSLKSIVIPDHVKTIGEGSFASCKNLKEVVIGKGVKRLDGWNTLNFNDLTSLTIHNTLEWFSDASVENTDIQTLYYIGTRADWNNAIYSQLIYLHDVKIVCICPTEHTYRNEYDVECDKCDFIREAPRPVFSQSESTTKTPETTPRVPDVTTKVPESVTKAPETTVAVIEQTTNVPADVTTVVDNESSTPDITETEGVGDNNTAPSGSDNGDTSDVQSEEEKDSENNVVLTIVAIASVIVCIATASCLIYVIIKKKK